MTETDRKKWDSRYEKGPVGTEPSPILEKHGSLAPVGRALDIAWGNGRNSVLLAEKGFAVDAVDISTVATGRLAGTHPKVSVICADLDTRGIPPDRCELIVDIRFLERRLFPGIRDGLKQGGALIFESFVDGEKNEVCLKQDEPLRKFRSFRVVYYEEKKADHSDRFNPIPLQDLRVDFRKRSITASA